jgi:hypothetical protein
VATTTTGLYEFLRSGPTALNPRQQTMSHLTERRSDRQSASANGTLQGHDSQRSDDAPRLVLTFNTTADRQRFITDTVIALKADPKSSLWRLVKTWGVGK